MTLLILVELSQTYDLRSISGQGLKHCIANQITELVLEVGCSAYLFRLIHNLQALVEFSARQEARGPDGRGCSGADTKISGRIVHNGQIDGLECAVHLVRVGGGTQLEAEKNGQVGRVDLFGAAALLQSAFDYIGER